MHWVPLNNYKIKWLNINRLSKTKNMQEYLHAALPDQGLKAKEVINLIPGSSATLKMRCVCSQSSYLKINKGFH